MAVSEQVIFGVSDFVAVVNQTFEYAYQNVAVEGEISNYRVSKNKWVYFDLKDEFSSVRCFATVFQLGGLFEDGMQVRVSAMPKLHNQYGFSLTIQSMQPVGEGALKRSNDLLRSKLEQEGLFALDRKRAIAYPPQRIALVASRESAAYGDFIKILGSRWGGIVIESYDVQVQGDAAPASLVAAISQASQSSVDVLVITRGGGGLDDLAAFNDERVVRAIAASRVPTVAAIGHERDESLTELAADMHASTPSNAAELLVPDRRDVLRHLRTLKGKLDQLLVQVTEQKRSHVVLQQAKLGYALRRLVTNARHELDVRQQMLALLNPVLLLRRGYVLVSEDGIVIRSIAELRVGGKIDLRFADGSAEVIVQKMYSDNKDKV